jgi:hypothetical protein
MKLMIAQYMKFNFGPMLFRNINVNAFSNSIVIDAIKDIELVGHYEGMEYVAPQWYMKLINSSSKYLIISNLDKVSKEKQKKFIEILKYKKIDIFDIPKYCKVIVNVNDNYKLDDEVYSLLIDVR